MRFAFRHSPLTEMHPYALPAAEAAEAAGAQDRFWPMHDLLYGNQQALDFLSGVRSGVNGTPTFFINGVRHDGAWDADSLTDALVEAAHIHA